MDSVCMQCVQQDAGIREDVRKVQHDGLGECCARVRLLIVHSCLYLTAYALAGPFAGSHS